MMQVPIDITICIGLAGIFLGWLIAFAMRRPLPQRLPSSAYFLDRLQDGRPIPFWTEWTPAHGSWAAHFNAWRRLRR